MQGKTLVSNDVVTRYRRADAFGARLLRTLSLKLKSARAITVVSTHPQTGELSLQTAQQRMRVLADATMLDASGRYAESLAALGRELEAFPRDKELLLARASTLYAWGRFREAYREFIRAEDAGLADPTLDVRLGWTCHQIGKSSEAESRMRKVCGERPDAAEAHFGLGVVLASGGRYDEAIASYQRVLDLAPGHDHCLTNLGVCCLRMGDLPAAETWLRRTLAGNPENLLAWVNLATTLWRQDREEAFDAFARAAEIAAAGSENGDLFANYGNALQNCNRLEEALKLFERELPRHPHVVGQGNYSMALLAAGRLAEGWNHYEFRWLQNLLLPLRANFEQPVWSGQDLAGKTILVRAEQGIGDVIQFIRYAPRLNALGAYVILQNRSGMDEIAAAFNGVDRVLEPNEPLPQFDYYVHVMSLPRIFGTDLDSIPAVVPYLRVDPVRVARWSERFANDRAGVKVGIVWAGRPEHERDAYRSIKLRSLLPICGVEGAELYSLQKGDGAVQLQSLEADRKIVDLQAEITDFAETAAAISLLDLVISVDTSVAHLAGALGRPVWILLPYAAEWRWLERREDTPWYPTARLFRQRRPGDWDDVVERVKGSLVEVVSELRGNRTVASSRSETPVHGAASGNMPRSIKPMQVAPGMSAVAETRHGIFQYLPDDDTGRSIAWYGEWLEAELALLARLIRVGQTVLEVDAGIGAHSVALGRAAGSDGHLILYELRAKEKMILGQNIRANGLANVTIMRRSLTGVGGLEPHESEADDVAERTQPSAHMVQRSETLDELQLERLDWLKLNDGRSAAELLEGGQETIWRLRPRLFARTTVEAADHSLVERLKMLGYRPWRMSTRLFNEGNFYRHDKDIFSGETAHAILAIPEEIDVDVALDGCIEAK